jgi:pyruvate-formate lyase-activating enzyme
VPDVTTTHDNLQSIADYLSGHGFPFDKVDLLPFHTTAGHKYERLHLKNEFAGIPFVSKEVIANIRMQHFHITRGKQSKQ